VKQACLVVLLLMGLGVPAAARSAPTLRLVDRTPVTVRGAGFAAGERVAVVLASSSRASRTVHADAGGMFVVRFRSSLGRCSSYTLQAYGATGTRARLSSGISPDCVPRG
jgi:hypothetical protein